MHRAAKGPTWDPRALPDLVGRTYLITGGTAGIGFFSALQLTAAGARVLLTGRNPNKLATARHAIEAEEPAGSVETLLLDTSNLGSVRAAAASVRMRDRLDGVLLNAGVVHPPKARETTGDGHELILATNVLGHFVLAGELLPLLAKTSGRMVWLGSLATLWRYDPVDPELVDGYTPWRAYVQSKIATTALGLEAERRLQHAGIPVESLVAQPGFSTSGRTRGIQGINEPSSRKRFVDNLQAGFTQSKEAGAWSPVRALVDPDAHGGELFGPKHVLKGLPTLQRPAALPSDREICTRLWSFCESVTATPWPAGAADR